MYSIKSGDVSYIVPMDDVDLTFLKRSEQIGENLKPLWSPRQQEYVEFQLKAWRTTDDEEQHAEDTTKTTMCHICDTRVPIVYLKEHNNSKKHKYFLKIIDEALTRLRNNININISTASPIETTKPTYFCEACSISVLTNYKDTHEASTNHKKSKKYDEILESFVTVLKKDNTNNFIDKNMDGHNSSATDPINVVETSKDGNNISATDPIKAGDTSKNDIFNYNTKNSNKAIDTSTNENNCITSNDIGTSKDGHINCSTTNSKNTRMNGNNSSATNSNKAIDTLPGNNFNTTNTMSTSKDGYNNCSISNSNNTIKTGMNGNNSCATNTDKTAVARKDEHINYRATNSNNSKDTSMDESNYVPKIPDSKLLKPLDIVKEYIKAITCKMTTDSIKIEVLNENYIVVNLKRKFRIQMDHFHAFVVVKQGLQCLLCNVIVNSKNDHIWTGQHMRWLIYHLPDEQCIRKINQYYFHCIVCNEMVRNVDKHKALDSNHTNKLKSALYNPTYPQTQPLMSNCKITADAQLGNENIEKNQSKSNQQNIKQTQRSETKYVHYLIRPIDFNDADVICILCKRIIPATKLNIKGHLDGKSHKKVYNDLLSTNRINKVQNGFTCDFCREYLPDKTEVDHASSEHHGEFKSGFLKFTTDKTYCEPCMTYIDTHNLDGHKNGQKHKNNASQQIIDNAKSDSINLNKTYVTATTNQGTNLNKEVTKGVSGVVSSKFEITPSAPVIDTKSSVPTSKINQPKKQTIEPSVSTFNVQSSTTQIKSPNTQTQSNMKNCQPKTNVQTVANISQPSTSGIKKNAATLEMKDIQRSMSTLNIKSSSENKTSDAINIQAPLKAKIHHHMKKTENPNRLICRVCDVPVPNRVDNITSHTNGINHKTNYKDLLRINNVVEVQSNFHCKKCNVHVTNRNEIDHIFGNKHKNAFSDDNSVSSFSNTSEHSNIEHLITKVEIIEYNSKLYLFSQNLITLELKCKICHIIVRNTVTSVIDHTNEANHVTNYNDLLEENRIVETTNGLLCTVCNENIPSKNELVHMMSTNHELRILKTLDDDADNDHTIEIHCNFCNIFVPSGDYSKHKISISHDSHVRNMSKSALMVYYYKTTEKSYIKCELCSCIFANDYKLATEHIEGSVHVTNYKKLLDINKICFLGHKMYCSACLEIISTNEVLVHIRNDIHSRNLASSNSGWVSVP